MSQKENLNTDSGAGTAQSLSVPLEFLKAFVGKRVTLKAFGFFAEDLLNSYRKVVATKYFIGEIQGKYEVSTELDKIQLRYPRHVINILSLAWVEIDGVKVVGA
jgi:hypothetical protein